MAGRAKEKARFGINQISTQVYTALQNTNTGQNRKLYRSQNLYSDRYIEIRFNSNWRRQKALVFEYRSVHHVLCAIAITDMEYRNIQYAVSNLFRYITLSEITGKEA